MSSEKQRKAAVFTQGPWWVDDPQDAMYIFSHSGMVAEIRGFGSGLPQEANAHLIAAAPEMYEALKMVWESSLLVELTVEQHEAINAAIAKAEGKPTASPDPQETPHA